MNAPRQEAAPVAVSLIGAPSDAGAASLGAAMGPDALRVARLGPALARLGLDVRDLGNLAGPPNPQGVPIDGVRHLAECVAWNRAVLAAVGGELAAGRVPVLLGGDHQLAAGSISAVAQHCRAQGRRLRVLWLDAHADFNTPAMSASGNVHGMPVAALLGLGPSELSTLAGSAPMLAASELCQIGLRSVDEEERDGLRQWAIEVYDMRTIDEIGMREVMRSALRDADAPDVHLHVSFDADFLDPSIAPGTGTPVRGGVNYREAQLCMEMIADAGSLASLDVVEVNPALDVRNQTAEVVVELIESLFGKSTLGRPRPSR